MSISFSSDNMKFTINASPEDIQDFKQITNAYELKYSKLFVLLIKLAVSVDEQENLIEYLHKNIKGANYDKNQ